MTCKLCRATSFIGSLFICQGRSEVNLNVQPIDGKSSSINIIRKESLKWYVRLCIPLLGCTKRCDINSTVTSRSSRDTRMQQVNVKVRSPSWFHVADLNSPLAHQQPPRPGLHVCHTRQRREHKKPAWVLHFVHGLLESVSWTAHP